MAYRKRMKSKPEEEAAELGFDEESPESRECLVEDSAQGEVVAEVLTPNPAPVQAAVSESAKPSPEPPVVKERKKVVKKFPRNIPKFSRRLS